MVVEVRLLMGVGPGAGPWQLDRGKERKWGVRKGEETNQVHTSLGLPGLVRVCFGLCVMENPKHLLNCTVIRYLINVLSGKTKTKNGTWLCRAIQVHGPEVRKWQRNEAVPTGGERFLDIRARH